MFEIMAERCNQCLYGKNKIVSNKRRAEILKHLNAKDDFFICHKATLAGRIVACRGDWENRGCGQSGRIAGRLDSLRPGCLIKYIDEAELKPLEESDGPESNRVRKKRKGHE